MGSASRRRALVGAVEVGPLVPFEGLLRAALTGTGYAPFTVDVAVRAMARLSEWMQHNDVATAGLTAQEVERFLVARRQRCTVEQAACRGVRTVVKTLRLAGVIPAEVPDESPVASLLRDFSGFLIRERGLSAGSARSYAKQSRTFLEHLPEPMSDSLAGLDAALVTSIVVRESVLMASGESAKAFVTAVRSLLRYLHVAGVVRVSLTHAVPRRAAWRLSSLPRGVEPEQVEGLLATAAGSDAPAGLRDYAVLTLLVRLGLRVSEAAGLMLGDLEWRSGQILVRGKGSTLERLPMPREVGQALTAYLVRGRPSCSCRAVFVTARAPYQTMSTACVREIMARSCRRAGLPRIAAHRLRHTLATRMLRGGAGLAEVGQVLRHRTELATAIYAKVDHEALRTLARPWPAGA
jgi:integrase/recombinase XerD